VKRSLRRLAANLLTGSVARFVSFLIDVVTAVAAYAGARLLGRRPRAES
jgi:hypothetical protein